MKIKQMLVIFFVLLLGSCVIKSTRQRHREPVNQYQGYGQPPRTTTLQFHSNSATSSREMYKIPPNYYPFSIQKPKKLN